MLATADPSFVPVLLNPSPPRLGRSLRALIEPLKKFTAGRAHVEFQSAGGFSDVTGQPEIRRAVIKGAYAGHDPIRLGIFAGLHGDEPAGCAALVELALKLAENPAAAAGYELYLYPVVNPVGYERGTRTNRAGKDLNREFWRCSQEPEVLILEQELRVHQFHGIITLHSDDTCEGVYGYAHGRTLNEALLKPALLAAEKWLPLDSRTVIDGFEANAGLICQCYHGVLSAPPDQSPRPFDLIFETPSNAPFDLQVGATVAALESIISTYPAFIAYAQDL